MNLGDNKTRMHVNGDQGCWCIDGSRGEGWILFTRVFHPDPCLRPCYLRQDRYLAKGEDEKMSGGKSCTCTSSHTFTRLHVLALSSLSYRHTDTHTHTDCQGARSRKVHFMVVVPTLKTRRDVEEEGGGSVRMSARICVNV